MEGVMQRGHTDESYGLYWPGKRAARAAADAPTDGKFGNCGRNSVGPQLTEDLFIEGDNLDALKLLRKTHGGRVRMIYIDPPYNTGQKLIYDDDFTLARGTCRKGGHLHSEWLSMIYPRLVLAREMLREDGAIFISIDDNEAAQLRLVCDEIFGPECFVNQIAVKSSEVSGVKMSHVERRLPKIKEYLLVYSRSPGGCRFAPVAVPKRFVDGYLKYYRSFIENPDEAPERWRIVPVVDAMRQRGIEPTAEAVRTFKLENAERVVYRTNNAALAGMSFDTETAEVISSRGNRYVWWRGKQMLFLSDYLTESLCDLWTDISTINLNKEMLGLPAFANGQKPLALLERCLRMVCPKDESSIVMDFFAGSGSFGHAAMRVRAEGYNINFVLVQSPEPCSLPGFATISALAQERLRRAAEKLSPEKKPNFRVLTIC